jgi:hypothetical protein
LKGLPKKRIRITNIGGENTGTILSAYKEEKFINTGVKSEMIRIIMELQGSVMNVFDNHGRSAEKVQI